MWMMLPILVLCQAGGAEEILKEKIKYAEQDVTEGGILAGKITWDGELPEVAQFPVSKNPEVCAHHQEPKTMPSPRLLVNGESRGVKNAVVFLADITSGKSIKTLKTPVLDQVGCRYDPHVIVVKTRGRLEMKSSDGIMHNIHAVGPSPFNKPFPEADKLIKQKLRKPGIDSISCDAGHSWMSGFIFIVQHPYFAVTDENGEFKLDGVPPGKYNLVVWHEGWNVTKATRDKDGNVTYYEFEAPKEIQGSVEVAPKAEMKLNFKLSKDGIVPEK